MPWPGGAGRHATPRLVSLTHAARRSPRLEPSSALAALSCVAPSPVAILAPPPEEPLLPAGSISAAAPDMPAPLGGSDPSQAARVPSERLLAKFRGCCEALELDRILEMASAEESGKMSVDGPTAGDEAEERAACAEAEHSASCWPRGMTNSDYKLWIGGECCIDD